MTATFVISLKRMQPGLARWLCRSSRTACRGAIRPDSLPQALSFAFLTRLYDTFTTRSMYILTQREKFIMLGKIVLLIIMGGVLAGAATTSTPLPILLVMGCLILFALSAAIRREQQQ